MRKLPKSFTTVTPLSKLVALSMLVIFPVLGFYLGKYYQKNTSQESNSLEIYSNSYFSFMHPINWTTSKRQNEITVVDLNNFTGSFDISWGKLDINSENWCKVDNTFHFPVKPYSFSEELTGCVKTIGNGNKSYIVSKTLRDGTTIIIEEGGNTFSTNDYLLMDQILSTFRFAKD